jgi:hypothetical protein
VAVGTNDYDYTTIKTDDIEGRISAIQKMMDFNDNLIAQL